MLPHEELGAVVPVGDAETDLQGLEELVLLELLLRLVVLPRLLDELPGGVEQEGAEDVEDPREVLDHRGAREDEEGPQHERDEHADEEHALLELRGDRELRHDQHEDEEIVDAERFLGDESGEELAALLAPREDQQPDTEETGEGDPDDRPDPGLLEGDLVGFASDEEVDRDHGQQGQDRDQPNGERDVHCASGSTSRHSISSSLPEVSSTTAARARGRRPGTCTVRIDGYAA
ncbi:putative integral membrane export protein [Streptomyces sp. Tu6071]|nr:putative integral membrane export protein [Streptomyces sp. Tu6071]